MESQKESANKANRPRLLLSVADAMKLVLHDEIDQSDFESDSDMMASEGKDGYALKAYNLFFSISLHFSLKSRSRSSSDNDRVRCSIVL